MTYLMDDLYGRYEHQVGLAEHQVKTYIRLFESFVNWHFTFRLVHSEQLVLSVASHFSVFSRAQARHRPDYSHLDLPFTTCITARIFPPLSVGSLLCLQAIRG